MFFYVCIFLYDAFFFCVKQPVFSFVREAACVFFFCVKQPMFSFVREAACAFFFFV